MGIELSAMDAIFPSPFHNAHAGEDDFYLFGRSPDRKFFS
jgi:hypothetical protein